MAERHFISDTFFMMRRKRKNSQSPMCVRFFVCVWFAGTIADRERARTYVVYGLRVRLSVDEGT